MPPRGRPSRGRGASNAAVNSPKGSSNNDAKMPKGWDPNDDSDDEYKPGVKRRGPTRGGGASNNAPSPKSARTSIVSSSPGPVSSNNSVSSPRPGPASRKNSVSSPAPGPASTKNSIVSSQRPASSTTSVSQVTTTPKPAPSGGFQVVQMKYDDESLLKDSSSSNSSMMHDCVICGKKEGRNLKLGPEGISDLKYHYAVCYYEDDGVNRYRPYMDPGQLNTNEDGSVIEEYGARFKYLCPFKDCAKNKAREKRMGFKEFCIHSGMAHNLVERVMEEDVDNGRDQLEPVLQAIARERKGAPVLEIPSVPVEEVHTCYVCKGKDKTTGKDDREAKYLSLTDNVSRTRYHYAQCIFDTGVYQPKYPPGPENTDENGEVKDLLGREIKYSCRVQGCSQKRMMGYKEFCIHMGNEHGGLDEVLAEDDRPEVRAMGLRIVKTK